MAGGLLTFQCGVLFVAVCVGDASGTTYAHNRLVWVEQAGTPLDDRSADLHCYTDGSSLAVGTRLGHFDPADLGDKEPPFFGPADAFAIKRSATGEVLWAKTTAIGLSDQVVTFYPEDDDSRASFLEDGRFAHCGVFHTEATFGPGDPNETTLSYPAGWHGYVASHNADGTLNWVRGIESSYEPEVNVLMYMAAVALAPDGTCYAIATNPESAAFCEGASTIPPTFAFVCYDADGNCNWVRNLDRVFSTPDTYQKIVFSNGVIALTDTLDCFSRYGALVWTNPDFSHRGAICSVPGTDDFIVVRNPNWYFGQEHTLQKWTSSAQCIWTVTLPRPPVPSDVDVTARPDGSGYVLMCPGSDSEPFCVIPFSSDGALGTTSNLDLIARPVAQWCDIDVLPGEDAFLLSGVFSESHTFASGQPHETTLTSHGQADHFLAKYRMAFLYYLDVDVIGRGNIALTPPGQFYWSDTPVTLRAAPNFPNHDAFVEWQGDFPGTDPEFTVSLSQDSHVTAVFEEIPGAPPLPALSLAGLAVLAVGLAAAGLLQREHK
ncbi:MAG TPA: hypothetical protein VMZ06_01250 [Candidatus Bathyarchaeia archaeon]|nr:hypothetical protein [Candidatus Bathyarchaeia archaeon]